MKSKRKILENLILDGIKNKKPSNPYICLGDITHCLFTNKKLGNVKRRVMAKAYRASKHQAKSLIKKLLDNNKIKVVCYMDLQTYII